MGSEPLDLGVVGVSEGNGHPYSFSAIVNGYDDAAMAAAGWEVIRDYLREADPSEFGFEGVSVTHAWTQDPAETETLCRASKIPTAADSLDAMADVVDAVLLARDDSETHRDFAAPFLDRGVPTFVDKPLALDPDDVAWFEPYLRDGLVMSCSGFRFARELDGPRAGRAALGPVRLVDGVVLNDWSKYGVHLLDAVFGVLDERPATVTATGADPTTVTITTTGEPTVQIAALGDAPITFDLSIYGRDGASRHQLRDNFRAFRRTLWHFFRMVRSGEPAIAPESTLDVVRTVIAGQRSLASGDPVAVDNVEY